MRRPLNVLAIEDSPEDAKLTLRELTRSGYEVHSALVATEPEMRAALARDQWDIILCDFALPHFDGIAALAIARELAPDVPFIYVSGAIGEETAVNAMRSGAHDYVMKHNLARLAPAVDRELREAASRREAKLADTAMRESEHKYRHLFESLSDAAFLFSESNGQIIDTNAQGEVLLKWDRSQIVGRRHIELYAPIPGSEPPHPPKELNDFGKACEAEIQRADGHLVPVHVSTSRLQLHGRTMVLALVRDITERRRADAALRDSERLYRSVVGAMAEGLLFQAADGRITAVNPSAEQILGRPSANLLGLNMSDQCWASVREDGTPFPTGEQPAMVTLRTGEPQSDVIMGIRRPNGSLVWISINSEPLIATTGGKPYAVVSTFHDITARREAEEALRESEQRFRQVTENIDEVFWLTNLTKDEMIYVSPAYDRIWGSSHDLLKSTPTAWLDAVHPDDHKRVSEAVLLQPEGGYDLEYRIVRPDGATRWIHDRAVPVRNAEGKVYRIAGVAEDVTERRQLEQQFLQSQKLEAVGQLAGGIAHDFNNLLTVVQMQTAMVLADARGNHKLEAGLQPILGATARGATLTRQLLTFSRRQMKEDARDLDLGDLLGAMTKLLRRILGEDIHLEGHFAPGLPLVHADPTMMEQILMNLLVNARDAMPNGGRLTIAIEAMDVDAAYLATHAMARAGRFVCLSVTDTGSGIPPEIMPRIFEPFFTTKEVGKGTGLGLATVFGIVQHHGGWIDVTSDVGQGTCFRVFLPAIDKPAERTAVLAPTAQLPGGTETVLVVEDEDMVRNLAVAALRRQGYKVIDAASGEQAIARWESCNGAIDLLLTDLVMPGGTSGQQLAQQLLDRQPNLKVIYSTGYSAEISSRKLPVEAGKDYLPKPYSIHDLTTIVRRRLDVK